MKKIYISNQKSLAGLALAALISVGAGIQDTLAATGKPKVERIDSREARITQVHVRSDDSKLRISGGIQNKFQRRGHIPGHLHIETYDHNGKLLIRTTSRYHRHNTKSRRSHFSEQLPTHPSKATKIRVIHHGLKERHC